MNKKEFCFFKELNHNMKFIKVFLWAWIFSGFILLMDIYNIPSSTINKIPIETKIIFIGILVAALILTFYNGHFLELCRFPHVNIIDMANICAMYISIICAFTWIFWIDQYAYKWSIALGLCVLFLGFFIGRWRYIKKVTLKNRADNNVYDLKDIYEGQGTDHSLDPILVSEKDVDYDLLGRNGIINVLYRSIVSCKSNSSFVIGLEGEWGSGKTTIINNVKRKLKENKDIVVIDSFDPWTYGTQDALLTAMYDSILRETGVKYSIYREKRIIESLCNMLVDSYSAGNVMQNLLFSQHGNYEEAKAIIEKLKQYVERTNKSIVFIIDNMDRAEGSNIIFLLKLIGNVFDLPNIIYVLSYDRNRINEILKDTTQINPKYVEKIVNQEIRVPLLQEERLREVYDVCIYNILEFYGMKKEEILNLESVIEVICTNVKDLRMFKRMINSVFVSVFWQENSLYKRDLLGVEVIRFIQPELYYKINENKAFFISHDRIINRHIYYESMDKKKFNSDGRAFFEQLFANYRKFKRLLIQMFPYVKQFADGNELQSEYIYPGINYGDISRDMRICSAKYFDLYFSYGSNEYLKIGKEISNMIDGITKIEEDDQLYNYICDKIVNIPKDSQREWFERLENYLASVPSEKKMILAKSIFYCLNKINSSHIFMELNAQSRALVCIEMLLEETEIDVMQEFADEIRVKYDKLYMIDQILYWFQKTRSFNTDDIKRRENILKERFSEMCEKVIEEKIDIYADPYYVQYNVWGLIRYLKIKENREKIVHDYVAQIINEKNIFRVMGDMISQSIGNKYGYRISDENFGIFFKDESRLDLLLQKVIPKTQSEEFVFKVYEKFKSGETNSWGEKEIVSETEVLLEL